jgi:hypothetical protein
VIDPALLLHGGHAAVYRLDLPFNNEIHIDGQCVTHAVYHNFEGIEAVKLFMTSEANLEVWHNKIKLTFELTRRELDVLFAEACKEAGERTKQLKRTGASALVLIETGTVTQVLPDNLWQNLVPVGMHFASLIDALQPSTGIFGVLKTMRYQRDGTEWNICTVANVVAVAQGPLSKVGEQALKDACHAFVPEFVLRAILDGGLQ